MVKSTVAKLKFSLGFFSLEREIPWIANWSSEIRVWVTLALCALIVALIWIPWWNIRIPWFSKKPAIAELSGSEIQVTPREAALSTAGNTFTAISNGSGRAVTQGPGSTYNEGTSASELAKIATDSYAKGYEAAQKALREVANSEDEYLKKKYGGGYAIFSVDQKSREIIPLGIEKTALKIDWPTAFIQRLTREDLIFRTPDITITEGAIQGRFGGTITRLPLITKSEMPTFSINRQRFVVEFIAEKNERVFVVFGITTPGK